MISDFYPNNDFLVGSIQSGKLDTRLDDMPSARMGSIEEPNGLSFKGVMNNMVGNLNNQVNEPDKLLKDVMAGNTNVDIHDVMTSMAKAELSINVATQVTGKVIQRSEERRV